VSDALRELIEEEAQRVYDVRCHCGWWLGKVWVRGNWDRITNVYGTCKRHGEVEAAHWAMQP
jgi:hypothetical protein